MSTQKIKIPRASDRLVEETFREVGSKYGTAKASISALGFNTLGQVELSDNPTGVLKALLDHDSYLIESMSFQIADLYVTYARGGQQEPKSSIYDEIIFSQNTSQTADPIVKLDLISFLNKKLRKFEPDRVNTENNSPEQSQLLAIHESTLERLERLNEDLISQSSKFRLNLENDFNKKKQECENDLKENKDNLEVEFRLRETDLEARENALLNKLKIIDDRNNTHVRREIRDRMLDDVKQRISNFGVSETTAQKRMPVLLGIILLIFTFAGLLAWTGYEIHSMDKQYFSMLEAIGNISSWSPDSLKAVGVSTDIIAKVSTADVDRTHLYWLWIRFTLFSFGLVGTLLYYIKWQNKWAEQHAISEFHLQQFYVDVNRANWVIESCLEWRKETESAIPRELLSSITNGLFVNNQPEPERVMHPSDELASALLGTASKLKLKLGDSEMEFDKPNKISKKPIPFGNTLNSNT